MLTRTRSRVGVAWSREWSIPVIVPSTPSSSANSRGRGEPDGLAVLLDLGAPRVTAAGDDAQAAAEGEQQVVGLGLVQRLARQDRRLDGGVVHLDPRVLDGAAHPDRDRRLAVQQRVGDELRDPQLGALGELGTPDLRAQLGHPAACVLHAAGSLPQGEGRPVERHGVSVWCGCGCQPMSATVELLMSVYPVRVRPNLRASPGQPRIPSSFEGRPAGSVVSRSTRNRGCPVGVLWLPLQRHQRAVDPPDAGCEDVCEQ